MFDPIYVVIGFVIGMLITTVFVPPTSKKKLLPDINRPELIFKNPSVENGCFRARAYQVSCTADIETLNK